MDVAWPENCAFTVSELIETEQRVIAHALEMTVVGCFFLIAVHRTLRTVNVQNHPLMDSAGHSSFYPPGIKQGKSLEVIVEYNEAIKLDPQLAVAYINRGNAYDNLGQSERAIQDYDEAIRLDPQDTFAYINRGVAYYNLDQFERAIED